jgi:gamma-glutamylputrescine oxidase
MIQALTQRATPSSKPLTGMSFWHRQAGAPIAAGQVEPRAAQPLSSPVDFVVVGGGFAGLSAALALADAEPAAAVLLLEANVLGYGASGRNGGLLSPLPAPVWLLSADTNAEHAWALHHINTRVHAVAAKLMADAPGGNIEPAKLRMQSLGRLTATGLARVSRTIERSGIAVERQAGTAGRLAVDLRTHTVDPYLTVLALGALARSRGIEIAEHSPVAGIEDTARGVRVVLGSGAAIEARRAIVCTNAYTGSVDLPEKVAAKVAYNFMVAAPSNNSGVVTDANRFTVELNTSYVFHRQHEGHIVYGGIERFKPYGDNDFAVPPDVLAGLEKLLQKSFPGVGLVPSQTWGGCYHQTTNDLPTLTTIGTHGHIVLNCGYGGTGVAMSMLCAPLAAALARDGKFASPDDRRLHDTIKATGLPIAGLTRLVFGVAGDVIRLRQV